MSIGFDDLITHRFRGFDRRENSLAGLKAALEFGVKHLEFDIRVARCGTPIIWHDEFARDASGRKRMICDVMHRDFQELGGDFAHFPTFDALLAVCAAHGNAAHLLVDIKDAGFEVEITSLIHAHRLQDYVTYVSWVPEALYAIHDLFPDAPLCLSHWCKRPGTIIREKHVVYTAKDGVIPRSDRDYIHGERSGWFVDGILSGDMLNIITDICVPRDMVTRDLIDAYHSLGKRVSVFSYINMSEVQRAKEHLNIDLHFIDKKQVFDALI